MEGTLKGFKINSKGYGIIPKLVMQDKGLNHYSKLIYAYLCSYTGGGDTCFPTRKKICYDLGISFETFSKYLNQLVEKGYIKVEQSKVNGRFSHNVYTLCDTINPPQEEGSTVYGLAVHGEANTNNNKDNINNKINKERKGKELKSSKKTFNVIIDNYTSNEQLRYELKEHLKIRKAKRAALTDHALELSLLELDKLAPNDDYTKILIVKRAIMNSYTCFYPLPSEEKYSPTPQRQAEHSGEASYNINAYEAYSIFDEPNLHNDPSGNNEDCSADKGGDTTHLDSGGLSE